MALNEATTSSKACTPKDKAGKRSTTEKPEAEVPTKPAPEPKAKTQKETVQTKEVGKSQIVTQQEDDDEDILEVYNQDSKEASEGEDEEVESLDLSDMNEEEGTGVPGFITYHWDGTFPEPISKLAKLFAKTPATDQVMQLEVMITVSSDRRPQVLLGDLTDVFTPFVVSIPGMGRQLKVVYAAHNGAAHDLFKDTQVENQLVCLSGEFVEGVQLPSTLVLPLSSLECVKVKVPEGKGFNEKRLDAGNTKETWYTVSQLTANALVPSLMPIPAFLVYDSFDKGIDAMVLYERWMKARTHDMKAFIKFNTVFRAFCKAQVVKNTTKEAQTRVKSSYFIEAAPPVTQEWKKIVLEYLFKEMEEATDNDQVSKAATGKKISSEVVSPPSQGIPKQVTFAPSKDTPMPQPTTPNPTPTVPPAEPTLPPMSTNVPPTAPLNQAKPPASAPSLSPSPTPSIAPKGNPTATPSQGSIMSTQNVKDLTLEEFVTVVATTTQTAMNAAKESAKVEKATKPIENLGMCKTMYERLLLMCGLSPGEDDQIPDMWRQISDKEMKTPMKKSLIKQWVSTHEYYSDAKVIMYAPLVQMIVNMDFEEDTTRSSKKSAAKGLTPFAVPTMTDREVDVIEDHAEAITAATQTTVKDMEKSTIEAESPKSFTALKIILRRFANLLQALFGLTCPLFREMATLMKSLDNYGDAAMKSMSAQTMASIVWLVHRQARHFAAGRMVEGATAILPEFSIMSCNVQCKVPVVYGDVPLDLYNPNPTETPHSNPTSIKRLGQNLNGTPAKKPRIKALASYNPIIKQKMEVFRDRAKLPRIKALCEAANIKVKELFPKDLFPVENFCQKSALFGTCFADCPREHKPVTNEQATHIVTKLKEAIDNPSKVKVTQ